MHDIWLDFFGVRKILIMIGFGMKRRLVDINFDQLHQGTRVDINAMHRLTGLIPWFMKVSWWDIPPMLIEASNQG